jgi:hypothetical protein
MAEKQLNVWIPEELRQYVAHRAEQEKRGMNVVIADLIREDMARREGEMVQGNALVVVREMLMEELRVAHAQLRRDLRADRQSETDSLKEWLKKQVDRLAGLIVMSVRNGGIARRLSYTHLSKTYGAPFAQKAYEHAREKANEELLPKKVAEEHVSPEED